MTSILTNSGAIVALQTLKSINMNLDMTQSHVSTGRTVNTAADGSAIWAVAKVMETDAGAFKVIQDGLNVAGKVVSTAVEGATKVVNSLKAIKERLGAAHNLDSDKTKNYAEITQLINQIKSDIDSAQINGVNLIKNGKITSTSTSTSTTGTGTAATTSTSTTSTAITQYKVLASLDRTVGTVTTTATSIDVDLQNLTSSVYNKISAMTAHASEAAWKKNLTTIENALDKAIKSAATLGALQSRIELQTKTTGELKDALTQGIGALVDTNLEEASARLKALQTQQQLGVQALSIANQSSQSVLALFR